MKRRWSATLIALFVLQYVALAQTTRPVERPSGREALAEPHAEAWFNNPPPRFRDSRPILLVFFETDGKAGDAFGSLLLKLERLRRADRLLIVGLTREAPPGVERFIREREIRFCVGAGSTSLSAYEVRETPAMLLVERLAESRWGPPRVVPADQLDQLVREYGRASPRRGRRTPVAQSGEAARVAMLAAATPVFDALFDRRGAHSFDTIEAYETVGALWERVGAEAPDAFAAELAARIPKEHNAHARGVLRYFRDLARGMDPPGLEASAGHDAWSDWREGPDAPEFATVRAWQRGVSEKPTADVVNDYFAHLRDTPADLVVRFEAIHHLVSRADNSPGERAVVRTFLLEALSREPDRAVRTRLAMALADCVVPGDIEVAGLMEELARHEPCLLRVRPALEEIAHRIRTGSFIQGTAPTYSE